MFRMEFRGEQSLDSVEEDDEPSTTYVRSKRGGVRSVLEQYRDRPSEPAKSPPKTFEGRVGILGAQMQQISSSIKASHRVPHLTPIITCTSNPTPIGPIQKNWVEVDLIDLGSPKAAVTLHAAEASPVAEDVIREFVKPFAESVNLTQQSSREFKDDDIFVTFLEYQPRQSSERRDTLTDGVGEVETESASFWNVEVPTLPLRSNSTRSMGSNSWSDSSDAEGSVSYGSNKDEGKGSPVARAYNRAFRKLMKKKSKPAIQEPKFAKPWEEPLLAMHEQVKLERKMQKEATIESRKLAEEARKEARKEAENSKRELLNLANPVPESALKNHKEQYNMRKGIHKLFGGTCSNSQSRREGVAADARESKLVMPRAGIFETCMSPSSTDVALAHIRSGPRLSARKDIYFATVESNQRDVEAWTMEEYMAKNSRLEEWESRDNDEEFGGIEGNRLLNQYFDDDVTNDHDSDSD
ncbi:uncharacterized protein [Physcomitrium patens]|uniref:Uncharacterized protein n=1 Tax=Physcomitrium patens TaxID=3218 RepID=A0A2K1IJA4_PHYPA|nr:uncharacterized protein LOC112275978 [Physcomitrium patens]XP_024362636.1 uncharacterized protein LOC112275978 [Physcomitrium patens]XP_024362638.1 uncharacterized protein LOC112275978 [Physcomitrium patens]XP_024362639.1 uncharacterized protein LOC112275978 [Physcomitrium patens]XP_024362640.1 uncharacterized protein LOC112275978 [Physcomitrium patens]PNR29356.1 hypothetical protein PHYPA_028049 [Physcomitrium patens]|eukprot:XP_024362635.1 uncharacterized protein LOC112275978 [Physcomitrella patens]